jgi:DNA polymerase phi
MAYNHNHSQVKVGLKYSPEFLQLFTDLASMDLKTRTTAGTELLKTVMEKQGEFEKAESKSGDHCPELQYTVKRLCKGLASSRDGARQGFATVLTEVIIFMTNLASHQLIAIFIRF